MTDSNLTRLALVKEVTPGVTPASPVMQKMRVTSVNLNETNQTVVSEQIRSDRLSEAEILVGRSLAGGFNFEFSSSHFDDLMVAALLGTRTRIAQKDNNGTADSVITDVLVAGTKYVVNSATSFKTGHLIRAEGFTNANNNGLQRVTSVTATDIVCSAATLTNETAPAAAAKITTIGFQGASGDITATAGGLGSTALDFTTLGLVVGQMIKISEESGFGFATAALNTYARITAIAANALTLDHKPAAWTTDAGTSKTIRVYVADYVRIGTSLTGNTFTAETAYLGQATPTYISDTKLAVNQFSLSFNARAKVTGSFSLLRGGDTAIATATLSGATYTAEPTTAPFNTSSNLSRISENGAAIGSPAYANAFDFTINNNLREIVALGNLNAVDLGKGEATVTGNLAMYFGDKNAYERARALSSTQIINIVEQGTKAYAFHFPTVQMSAPRPNAQGKNQDIMVNASFNSSANSTYATNFQVDMFYEIDPQ